MLFFYPKAHFLSKTSFVPYLAILEIGNAMIKYSYRELDLWNYN